MAAGPAAHSADGIGVFGELQFRARINLRAGLPVEGAEHVGENAAGYATPAM